MTPEQAKVRALSIMNGERNFSYRIEITAGGRTFDVPLEAGLGVLVEEIDDEGNMLASERVKILETELLEYRLGYWCDHCGSYQYQRCESPKGIEGWVCDNCRIEAAKWNPDMASWCKAKGYHYEGEVIS